DVVHRQRSAAALGEVPHQPDSVVVGGGDGVGLEAKRASGELRQPADVAGKGRLAVVVARYRAPAGDVALDVLGEEGEDGAEVAGAQRVVETPQHFEVRVSHRATLGLRGRR